MNLHATRCTAAAALLWLAVGAATAAERAGTVALVTGQATASDAATMAMRTLQKDDAVYAGEIVSSGPNSYVNLKFEDGGFILLRPNSRFEIEQFANPPPPAPAEPAPAAQPSPAPAVAAAATPAPLPTARPARPAQPTTARAFFRLLKGGFRAVSGLIGKGNPEEYRINTPVATIGIRGTDYWVILCDAACAADPALVDGLQPGQSPEGGVIVGVISGEVFVANDDGGGSPVGEGQYLIALPDGTQLYLPYEPRFLRLQPIPDPTTICEPE